MRNLKLFLSVLIASFTLSFATAQEALAFVELPEARTFEDNIDVKEDVRIDKSGIIQISEYLSDHLAYPFAELDFAKEINITLQVSLNAFGEVIDYRIAQESTQESVDQNVLETMSNLKRVSPILFNGTPKAQTVQIPLIFKS